MRVLKKLTEEEKKQTMWEYEFGIVDETTGEVLFNGSYQGCLDWLGSGN